jgi:hypothetical protein
MTHETILMDRLPHNISNFSFLSVRGRAVSPSVLILSKMALFLVGCQQMVGDSVGRSRLTSLPQSRPLKLIMVASSSNTWSQSTLFVARPLLAPVQVVDIHHTHARQSHNKMLPTTLCLKLVFQAKDRLPLRVVIIHDR